MNEFVNKGEISLYGNRIKKTRKKEKAGQA